MYEDEEEDEGAKGFLDFFALPLPPGASLTPESLVRDFLLFVSPSFSLACLPGCLWPRQAVSLTH